MSDSRGDPLWSKVIALFHFDGANGAKTLVNETGRSSTGWAFEGNAALSSSQSKFGTTSLYLDGADDTLSMNGATGNADGLFNLGTGDFCTECWLYLPSLPATSRVVFGGYTQNLFPKWYISTSGQIQLIDTNWRYSSNTVPVATWSHVAVDRKNNVLKFFINGVQGYSTTKEYSYSLGSSQLNIGAFDNGSIISELNGYIDEVRITKASRYRTNFTVPSEAFPAGPYQGMPVKDNQLRKPIKVNGNTAIHKIGI